MEVLLSQSVHVENAVDVVDDIKEFWLKKVRHLTLRG